MSQKEQVFNQEALSAHNYYRCLHGISQLRLSDSLTKSAQEWAEKLVHKAKLENSPVSCKGEVGENISSRSSTASFVDISGKEVTDQWYKDINNYDFNTGTGNAGNFTQIVWSGSHEVGFGKAHHNGKCIVVAHYKPAGNVRGRYQENVNKPNSSAPVGQGGGAPPKGTKTKTTVVTETVTEPSGKTYTVKREIEEYTDDFGNITERVKEIRLDNPTESGAEGAQKASASSSSDDEKHEEVSKDQSETKPEELVDERVDERFSMQQQHDPVDAEYPAELEEEPLESIGHEMTCSEPVEFDEGGNEEEAEDDSDGGEKKKELDIFVKDVIDSHNTYRKKHGAGPLTRNKELEKMAQEWAENLARAERLSNSNYKYKGNRLGENIASRWSNGPCDYSGKEVADHWYSEEKKHDYGVEPTNVQGIGNFTQLVWKNSKEIGVAKAIHTGPDGTKVIVVCHYFPAGNVLQCFCDNVAKP